MRFHQELNPKLWDKNNEEYTLQDEVKAKLEEIAEAFIEYLEIPKDAVLDKVITGSSASYNYTEFSDLDLHIIVDFDKVHKDCPVVEGYLSAMKSTFNKEHDIFIHGVPVELYAEKKDQGTVHNGLYSLQTGWIDIPQKIEPTDNDAAVEAKYNELKELIDKCETAQVADELLDKIYTMRKAGLADAGEFCTENLAFKKLRNENCMDKLRQLKKQEVDKQLSLESYNESLNKKVFDLLLEGGNLLGIDSSFTEEFEKRFDKIKATKSIKQAKDLLIDLVGHLVDEKYSDYCKKVWNFMNNKLQEHVDVDAYYESIEYPTDREELITLGGSFTSGNATIEISNLYNSKQGDYSAGFGSSYCVSDGKHGKVFNNFDKAIEYMKKLNNKSVNESTRKYRNVAADDKYTRLRDLYGRRGRKRTLHVKPTGRTVEFLSGPKAEYKDIKTSELFYLADGSDVMADIMGEPYTKFEIIRESFEKSLDKEDFKIKVILSDGKERFYKAKDLDAAKIKFSDLCIRFNNCELLQGDKVLYKQNESACTSVCNEANRLKELNERLEQLLEDK